LKRKTVKTQLATISYEKIGLAVTIENEDGVHTHTRNGEHFKGKQQDCPLCANGSEFEKLIGRIGA